MRGNRDACALTSHNSGVKAIIWSGWSPIFVCDAASMAKGISFVLRCSRL
jgi:hypothetical protein